ncbi:MAG: hypothetical protein AAFV53_21750 [Myxococcota bacterium]
MTRPTLPLAVLLSLGLALTACLESSDDDTSVDEADTDTDTDADTDTDTDADADTDTDADADLICDDADLTHVYRRDGSQEERCYAPQQCVVGSDGEAMCGCVQTGVTCYFETDGRLRDLHEPSWVAKEYECASDNADPTDPANRVDDCDAGLMCFEDEDFNDGIATCASSIAPDAQGHPFAEFGCTTFNEGFLVPTRLGVDCRCRTFSQGAVPQGDSTDKYAWPGGDWPQGPLLACQSEYWQRSQPWKVPAGTGPRFDGWKENGTDRWLSIGLDAGTRQLYAAVRHRSAYFSKPTTAIVRWDIDNNDREVITGAYYDVRLGRSEAGSGYATPVDCTGSTSCANPLWGVGSGVLSDDGWIYTLASQTGEGASSDVEIVRTRISDGLRELFWQSDGTDTEAPAAYGQCRRSTPQGGTGKFLSVPWVLSSLTRGPDGTLYMAFFDTSRSGKGLAALSADGRSCTVLSRYGARDGDPDIGRGFEPQFQFSGLLYHDGALYAVETTEELYEIDPATGDRAKVSFDTASSVTLGNQSMFWDDTREVFWLAGDDQISTAGAIVDPATGRREPLWNDQGYRLFGDEAVLKSGYVTELGIARGMTSPSTMLSNANNYLGGTLALDPDDPDIFWAVITGGRLMKFDLTTFNNYTYSY